jgi:small-conductance mechanosensitive channel
MNIPLPDVVTQFIPLLISVVLVIGLLWLLHWLLIGKQTHLTGEQKLPRQLTLLFATIIGIISIVLALPVSDSSRNQIIGLIGVLLSGIIAFSSTTIVSNLMAGVVLRINKPFRVGDFVKINGFSGRVAEMGLLDTEIQTENRELISFANTHLLSNPVTVVRSSGAIISVELSLGYELHHSIIEKNLLAAAQQAELEEPFVQVISLGDFSVSYRIAGLLVEVKSMLSARSRLHKAVLDQLHKANIEIVSPSFMNQRPQTSGERMIPNISQKATAEEQQKTHVEEKAPEDILFDKAEQAAAVDKERQEIEQQIQQTQTQIDTAEGEQKTALKQKKEQLKEKLTIVKDKEKQQQESELNN